MFLSWKTLVVGIIGIVAVVFITTYAELVTGQIMIGFLQLPPVVVALLFVLVLANRWVAGIRKSWALSARELAVVYVMMLLSAMVSSRGLMEKLLPTLAGPNYLATPIWHDLYFPHIPRWIVPWDPKGPVAQEITKTFYEGLGWGSKLNWWHPWLRPLLIWSILIAFVFLAFIFLSAILRRQWVDNEKLNFPLVQLPLEMINDRPDHPFLSNPVMWIGFAIPFCYFGVNGIHNINPAIPQFPISMDLLGMFTGKPWNQMSMFTAFFSMAAFGFFCLLPVDLLFSLWFFYILAHLQEVVAASFGMNPLPGPHGTASGMTGYQSVGAWLALSVYLFLLARPHLKRVWQCARHGSDGTDRNEVVPYRTAVWGLALCMIGITCWGVSIGMTWWVVLGEFGVFIFIQAVIMARAVAEGGVIMAEGVMTPKDLYTLFSPANHLGAANLTGISFFDALFTRDLRGLTLSGFLDAQKLADGVKLERRKLLSVFIIGLVVAVVTAASLQLYLPYHMGAVKLYSYEYFGNNCQFFRENTGPISGAVPSNSVDLIWLVVGILVTVLLVTLRIRLDWFTLHPLGYALTTSWMMTCFWAPILFAWIVKSLVIRYGGMRFFVKVRPLFLGMVFGEFAAAVVWTLIAAVFSVPAPAFPWP